MLPPGAAPPVPVRLVTFNTHHGVGDDDRHDLPRLAALLAATGADLICLQEVDRHFGERSEDVDQAELLARALDLHLAWGPTIDRPGTGRRRQYGNALLSRLPVLHSDVVPLPGAGEPRSALRTRVRVGTGELAVVTTHLSTGPAGQRAAQAAVLAELAAGPAPGVLAGDLNAEPDATELAPLRARYRDAWAVARHRDDRAGWQFRRSDAGHTHPARRPRRRIDSVWVSGGVDVAAAEVAGGAGASDHLPLVVDLAVQSGV